MEHTTCQMSSLTRITSPPRFLPSRPIRVFRSSGGHLRRTPVATLDGRVHHVLVWIVITSHGRYRSKGLSFDILDRSIHCPYNTTIQGVKSMLANLTRMSCTGGGAVPSETRFGLALCRTMCFAGSLHPDEVCLSKSKRNRGAIHTRLEGRASIECRRRCRQCRICTASMRPRHKLCL